MIRLMKYLKPYSLLVIAAIGLLFAQANLELALPDYLSDIVDTGIQQGGIENAVPLAIRKSEMDRLFIFMDSENQTEVLNNYTLEDENSTDYDNLVETYPIIANESIYVRNKMKKAEIEDFEEIIIRPLVVVFTFEQALADPANATEMLALFGFNETTVPPAPVFFNILSMLPPSNLTMIVDMVTLSFEALGGSLLYQVGAFAVKFEYEAIGMNTDRIQNLYILKAGGLMLLMTLLAVICTIAVSYLASRTSSGWARDIRSKLFRKVESFSSIEFDKFSTASLITRSTNDITQIQMAMYMLVRMVFYAPILGVGGIIHALAKSRSMWWLIGTAVAVLVSLVIVVFFVALPKFKIIQKLTDKLNLVSRESLSGMLVIRAFNMEKHEEARFDEANVDVTAVSLFVTRIFVILMPIMMIVLNGLAVGIIWVGAHKVAEASMQVGDMMAFLQYSMQIVFAFLMLTMMFIILPRAFVSGKRINDVLTVEPEINDPEDPKEFPEPFKGSVEFRDVSFTYPGAKKNVVENITFTAKSGETTAFIGSTGSGKSSLVNLIPRFYEVSAGAILIDGIDIREVTQYDLREKIGYIPQKSTLFSGTIETNLLFADDEASEQEMQEALDIAQATEFVTSKEEGMQSEIAQGGMNVSGGQKQ
ncbi:MAG: ABC transporter ATP-binding protein, partial [Candidatus Heimdallarchaeaceae archaeon]